MLPHHLSTRLGPKPQAEGLPRITCRAPCAPRLGSPSRLPPVSQVQLNRITEWSEQEEGINEMETPGAASSQRACVEKIASWPFLLNEAVNNMPVAFYPVTRSKAPVIHQPSLVFVYENKIRWGGLQAEALSSSCERQEYEAAFGLWQYVIHVVKKSNQPSAVPFPFFPPLSWVKNQKILFWQITGTCYFNSKLMVTICRIKVHVNILLRGQE